MKALDLREVPIKGRDRVGHVEQARRPSVASPLVVSQRALGPRSGREREQFSVNERVGHPVGRDRVLEVARIADERPPRP